MEQRYQILQKQKQILSYQQLQSLNILTMDNVELDLFLQSEYLENPMLEHAGNSLQEGLITTGIEPPDEDGKWNRRIEESESLKSILKNQLVIGADDEKKKRIKEYMIECVEDSGYFTIPLEDVAENCQESVEIVGECLEELKKLEPIGVFSANLEECLLIQLSAAGVTDQKLETMIRFHLSELAEGNISHISRTLQISTAQVRKYALLISALNPRPVMGVGGRDTEYIIPDIIMRQENGWEIELNDSWMGEYQISDYYLGMMSKTEDPELKEYFREKARRVRFILQNVEQRRQTLLTIMYTILEWQRPYFEGNGKLKPMTMTDIANEIEVHPSTISRAVKGKYVQFPKRTILMKEFFTQGFSKDMKQEEVNSQHIKERIRLWIQKEDKRNPYSDQKIREMLEEDGILVSRRVVAKYRDSMGIKGSFDRKERGR